MTLGVKCGSFTKSGTSNTITTTFKVKGLILYNVTVGATAAGTYQGSGGLMVGISDGTNHFVSATTSTDGAATSATFQTYNNFVACTFSVPATLQDTGTASFGASTDFTVNWSNGGTPQTPIFYYVALGGDDITNAQVMGFDANTTAAGNRAYTGLTFQPDFGFVLNPFKTATGNNLTFANSGLSAFMSTTRRWAMCYVDENSSNTQDSWKYLRTTMCVAKLTNAGAVNCEADFVQWNADGFTWNWSNAPAGLTEKHAGLFIKGGQWDVGSFTKPTTTGAQDQVITLNDGTLIPKLVMLASVGQIAHTAPVNQMTTVALGATDGTTEGTVWMGCGPDASDPMINASINLNNKVYRDATANTTHTSSTINEECSIVTGGNMATAGQFTLDWTTVGNTTAKVIGYIVLGELPPSQTFPRNVSDTITLSDSATRPLIGRSVSETTSISESLSRLATALRSPSDTTTVDDTVQKSAVFPRPAEDTINLTESLNRLVTVQRTTSDTTNLSDSATGTFIPADTGTTFVRNVSDSIGGVQEQVTHHIHFLADSIEISEPAIGRVYTGLRTSEDTTSLSESITRLAEFFRLNLADTIILSEIINSSKVTIRQVADTIIQSDTAAKLATLIRNVQDSTTLDDSVTRVKTAVQSLTDTTNLSESIQTVRTFLRSAIDTTNLSDSVSKIATLIRSLADSTILSEVVNAFKNPGAQTYIRTVFDTVPISEEITRILTALRSTSDTITLSDTVQKFRSILSQVSDTVILSDTVQRVFSALRTAEDTIIVSDTATKFKLFLKTVSDTINLTESISRLYTALRTAEDTAATSELIQSLRTFTKQVEDSITSSDTIQKFYVFARTAEDTIITSDTVQRIATYLRSIEETTTISEAIQAILIPLIPASIPRIFRRISARKIKGSGRKWKGSGRIMKGSGRKPRGSALKWKGSNRRVSSEEAE